MSTDTKCIEFAKQVKALRRDYGMSDKTLSRDEVANAFESLLEIVTERGPSTANRLAPEWATLATHLATAAGRPIGDLTPTNIGHVAKEAAYCATNLDHRVTELKGTVTTLRAEVTDLRRQKTDLETALGAAVTGWNKDKAGLESQLATLKQSSNRYHDEACDLRAERDAATKRAELAEATLESVRAAVAKPVEDKDDTRPKIGDRVPWVEAESGALYARHGYPCPFRMVIGSTGFPMHGPGDSDVTAFLSNPNTGCDLKELAGEDFGVLIARDLGSDPEAWRAAMREHLAKVGA